METIHNRVSAAKEIKQLLKKIYPSIKFSVKSDIFAGGDSINVSWNLGPTQSRIQSLIEKYQEGSFDGMTDSYNYESTLVLRENGEIAKLGGAKYVHAHREYRTQEEIDNYKLPWKEQRKLWDDERSFYHIVGKDICKAANIEYQGLEMCIDPSIVFCRQVYAYGPNTLRDCVYQLIQGTDFLDGYHGIKQGDAKNEFIAY